MVGYGPVHAVTSHMSWKRGSSSCTTRRSGTVHATSRLSVWASWKTWPLECGSHYTQMQAITTRANNGKVSHFLKICCQICIQKSFCCIYEEKGLLKLVFHKVFLSDYKQQGWMFYRVCPLVPVHYAIFTAYLQSCWHVSAILWNWTTPFFWFSFHGSVIFFTAVYRLVSFPSLSYF